MTQGRFINVCGHDPSLRNWGMAGGQLNIDTLEIVIRGVVLLNPVYETGKQVRQNSKDLEAAAWLYKDALKHGKQARVTFVEVPVGSKSARAMASYGICVGVLGALRHSGISFFEVTPNEVKLAAVGKKTATKDEMIDWAVKKHPNINWQTFKKGGIVTISKSHAEHMADAVAAIYAGVSCNAFLQMLPVLRSTTP